MAALILEQEILDPVLFQTETMITLMTIIVGEEVG
jgi:hypothetical protein